MVCLSGDDGTELGVVYGVLVSLSLLYPLVGQELGDLERGCASGTDIAKVTVCIQGATKQNARIDNDARYEVSWNMVNITFFNMHTLYIYISQNLTICFRYFS